MKTQTMRVFVLILLLFICFIVKVTSDIVDIISHKHVFYVININIKIYFVVQYTFEQLICPLKDTSIHNKKGDICTKQKWHSGKEGPFV